MKRILIFLCLLSTVAVSHSQDLENLVKGSAADANYLVKGYVTPLLNSVGAGFAQGWYNTAKPHKLLGFDLTVTASAIYFPSSDLVYKVENSAMSNLVVTPVSETSTMAPTILGSETAPRYQLKSSGVAIDGAPGLDLKNNGIDFVPAAMVQLGIGLPKGTDLKIRFFPSTKIGDNGTANMLGFGVMHDIKQHIPGVKNLPFDLSAFVGHTNTKLEIGLDDARPDQKATFETNATTIQGLISKKLSVVTFYAGLGYNFTSASLAVKGRYYLDNTNTVTASLLDPVNFSVSQSGPRATIGMRLKLLIFTFHGDYTLQKYNALTVGFGLNIR